MDFKVKISPKTITIITTYKCTAACEDCCFECTPSLTSRLELQDILDVIQSAFEKFSDLELVVFTGGECFILKQDLYDSIAFCTSLGLKTRCVTNAYWGKTLLSASKVAHFLKKSRICEINISTGLDHQKWVPQKSVINAVNALVSEGIFVLVTIEKDSKSSSCFEHFVNDESVKELTKNSPELFKTQSNVWMSFMATSEKRENDTFDHLENGCDQIFNNCVITPKKEVSACCGLTLEHIPEMKLGTITDLDSYKSEQQDDFLKLWLRVDGPYVILKKILGYESPELKNIQHQCQACAVLHKKENVRKVLLEQYQENIIPVVNKFKIMELEQVIAAS